MKRVFLRYLPLLSTGATGTGSFRQRPARRQTRPLPAGANSNRKAESRQRSSKVRELDRLLLLDVLAFVVLLFALFCIKAGR